MNRHALSKIASMLTMSKPSLPAPNAGIKPAINTASTNEVESLRIKQPLMPYEQARPPLPLQLAPAAMNRQAQVDSGTFLSKLAYRTEDTSNSTLDMIRYGAGGGVVGALAGLSTGNKAIEEEALRELEKAKQSYDGLLKSLEDVTAIAKQRLDDYARSYSPEINKKNVVLYDLSKGDETMIRLYNEYEDLAKELRGLRMEAISAPSAASMQVKNQLQNRRALGGGMLGIGAGLGLGYAINQLSRPSMSKYAKVWTRKEGQDEEGGLNQKGRDSYNRETGGNLKRPVSKKEAGRSEKAAARRKSFCARMSGMKKKLTSKETARDPDSRINKALRKWDC